MPNWLLSSGTIVFLLAAALLPLRSDACSCADGVLHVSPSDGATGVPLNAEIKMLVGFGSDDLQFRLESDSGEVVPTHVVDTGKPGYIVLRPDSDLGPNTRYSLLHPPLYTDETEDRHVASFTTGAARDEAPPTNGPAPTLRWRDDRRLPFAETSCGHTYGYETALAPAEDDASPPEDVWYHLYVGPDASSIDRDTIAAAVPPGGIFLGAAGCLRWNPFPNLDAPAAIQFAAVDVAGNEATPTDAIEVGPSCGCVAGGSAGPLFWVLAAMSGAFCSRRRWCPGSRR